MDTFSTRLAARRAALGLSTRELGARAELSHARIADLERGVNPGSPSTDTVARLAAALGCSPGWLAYGEGEAPAAAEPLSLDDPDAAVTPAAAREQLEVIGAVRDALAAATGTEG